MMCASVPDMPPAWFRKAEVMVLMRVFSDAFGVEPPALTRFDANTSLYLFREFTAACMEMAREDEALADHVRTRLGTGALKLGSRVRLLLGVRPEQALEVARFFYRGIGIELCGELPGALCFSRCSFAQRYDADDCRLMAAFDEGFMRGLTQSEDYELVFSCRLTQGASCCQALFSASEKCKTSN